MGPKVSQNGPLKQKMCKNTCRGKSVKQNICKTYATNMRHDATKMRQICDKMRTNRRHICDQEKRHGLATYLKIVFKQRHMFGKYLGVSLEGIRGFEGIGRRFLEGNLKVVFSGNITYKNPV